MIYYKHRETGEIYKTYGLSNFHNQSTTKFKTVVKHDGQYKETYVTTDWITDPEQYDFSTQTELYRAAQKKNEEAHKENINKIFETVDISREIIFHEVPKYIKVTMSINCPFCGSKMKPTGQALLSSPVQYPHICTNENCGYTDKITGYKAGDVFYGTSVEEVENILLHGTEEEYEELRNRSKQFK